MLGYHKTWWVASVLDMNTMQTIRFEIDAVLASDFGEAYERVAERNPLKPHEFFCLSEVTCRGANGLCSAIRDGRTRKIVGLKNLIVNAVG